MIRKLIRYCMLMGLLLAPLFAHAAEKSAEELCRERNAAKCEVGSLQFNLTEQECPKGTKVLRKLGHENCNKLEQVTRMQSQSQVQATSAVVGTAIKDSDVVADKNEGEVFYWGNPYFILALIGLLQGMISRAGTGSLIVVMLVMPLLGTWSIVSDVHMEGGPLANAGYIGMELLGTCLFSMFGWLAGAGVRRLAYRLLLGI